jgi:hypothetical protein
LNSIIGLYDNKDKQDKQNMSYWKEIIFLCAIPFHSSGFIPKQGGKRSSHKQLAKLL